MPRKALLEREKRKAKTVARYADKIKQVKQQIKDGELPHSALHKFPRDARKVRLTRRCRSCGRAHGVFRLVGLCRICLRVFSMQGDVPGMKKSSW